MTKVISIADDAYGYLMSLKNKEESFSMIIRRLIPKTDRRSIMELAGALKDDDLEKAVGKVVSLRSRLKFKNPSFAEV